MKLPLWLSPLCARPVVVAVLLLTVSRADAARLPAVQAQPASGADRADRVAEAYSQFLLGRHLETTENIPGAIDALKRAVQLDPQSPDIAAELAGLFMRQSRLDEAVVAADQALKVAPANREAHRVLGIVYATLVESGRRGNARSPATQAENIKKAIQHLEQALDRPSGEPDPNVRATLARLYITNESYDKAIPLLVDLVNQEPGWADGPGLLAQAYASAGRNAEAITWLTAAAVDDPDLYQTLAGFYERERRWSEAAGAYAQAIRNAPRSTELKTQYASALINAGGRDSLAKARDVFKELLSAKANDPRSLFQLSQVERRLGDFAASEEAAHKLIAQSAQSPMGYYALAMSLEERRQYREVVDTLAPAVAEFRSRDTARAPASGSGGPTVETAANPATNLVLLLPHLGFAYQELGDFDKAIGAFDEAHRLAPTDTSVTAYLIQANLSAKKYNAALELVRKARVDSADDLRFARLEAQALRQSGKPDQAVSLLQDFIKKQSDRPEPYVALAQLYSETKREGDAVRVLQDAQSKFPADTTIPFQLGAVLDKQKKFSDAESAFRQVLSKEPDNAQALNYLGYMLADRGERLDESVGLLKKALAVEPDNGSYLDSLGWAYYKADKLDLAVTNLERAAEQLKANSVIQDHYGDVLFKLSRFDDAIAAWNRAIEGDGDTIDRASIDKKIRSAKQKLGRK
jgi:tetratricopeptide (TPR) repeat protein